MSNQYLGDDRIVHEPLDVPKASSRRIYSNSEAPDDIVTRLRVETASQIDVVTRLDKNCLCCPCCEEFCLFCETVGELSEAADEIEHLRADLENVRNLNEHLTQELQSYYNEDEEIRRGRSGE